CWIVGGAVRDALRGAELSDLDLVLDGEVAPAARRVAAATAAHAFALSDAFGAWRVVERAGAWHADLNPLRGATIEADLARRDFTVNAIAQPLEGGELVDPLGGARDLERGVLRIAGPHALDSDPLRAMRLVRLRCELDLTPDPQTVAAAREVAPRLREVAAERVYAELSRVLASDSAAAGVALMGDLGLTAAVLPELAALGGIDQSRFHHLDVADHTLAVLAELVELARDPARVLGDAAAPGIAALLAEPLADELTRGTALRFGALLHDIAKPQTRTVATDGRVAFPGHDERGGELARGILGRLRAAERVRAYVAALTRHHLRLGFLVHRRPLSRADLYDYLLACGPVAADVTLLSVADRLATRGDRAEESIARHLELAREVIGEALRWHAEGPPRPPLGGAELMRALGIGGGPRIGDLLAQTTRAAFTGEIAGPEQAIEYARSLIA
ncbi:MAG TPA: HD domain-containing protein, partial [Solirubrobacteraceae bacterium]|nr:HD domain-containing protein [Solirubrobacteraceae bacterium]